MAPHKFPFYVIVCPNYLHVVQGNVWNFLGTMPSTKEVLMVSQYPAGLLPDIDMTRHSVGEIVSSVMLKQLKNHRGGK